VPAATTVPIDGVLLQLDRERHDRLRSPWCTRGAIAQGSAPL